MIREETILKLKYLFANLVFSYFFSLGVLVILKRIDFMDFVINNPHFNYNSQLPVFIIVLLLVALANILAYFTNNNNLFTNYSKWKKILYSALFILIYFLFRGSELFRLLDTQYFSFSKIFGSEEFVVLILAFSYAYYLNIVVDITFIKSFEKYIKNIWWIVATLSVILFFLISYLPFSTFSAPAADVGLFNQLFYNYSRFASPYSTIRGVTHIWADHFHPTIMLLVPFYWVVKSPIVILILQALVAVSGIIPIYLIVNKITKSYLLSLSSMIVYVLYPGLQMALNFGFYPENMAPALFLWAFWFLISNKIWKYFIFLILWIGLKESIPLHALALGVYIYFWGDSSDIKHSRVVAITTIFVSLAWFLIATKVIIPAHSQDFFPWAKTSNNAYIYADNYKDFGNSFSQIIKSIISNPLHAAYVLFHPEIKIYTILKILTSFGGLVFVPISLISLPMFGENFLSSRFVQYNWNFHYQAQFAGILSLVAVLSIFQLYKKYKNKKIIYFGSVYLILSVLFASLLTRSPMTSLAHFKYSDLFLDNKITTALNQIPKNASVSAQNNLAPILSSRDTIYLFPRVDGAEYLVLSPTQSRFPLTDDEYQMISQGYLNGEHNYKIVIQNEKIIILRKDQ